MMLSPFPTLAFLGNIGPVQWVIIGVVGLLIFGKRLPEVGKSLGKGIVEFKKGLQGIGDEINKGADSGTQASKSLEDPTVHTPHHYSHADSPPADTPHESTSTSDSEKSSQA